MTTTMIPVLQDSQYQSCDAICGARPSYRRFSLQTQGLDEADTPAAYYTGLALSG